MAAIHTEWSSHAPREHTYFIVARSQLDGRPLRIEGATSGDHRVAHFQPSSFPLNAVAAILLHQGLRHEFPNVGQDLDEPWSVTAFPTGRRTEASGWRDCIYWNSDLTFEPTDSADDLPASTRSPEPVVVPIGPIWNSVEGEACGYVQLAVPESALGETAHPFLTSGQRSYCHRLPCRVRLSMSTWIEFPGFAERDQYSSTISPDPPAVPRSMPDPLQTALDRIRKERSEIARQTGPHPGSFISCSLWSGLNPIEPECVLEIVGDIRADGSRDSALHVLSESADVHIEKGMSLQTWGEVYEPQTKTRRDLFKNLGEIHESLVDQRI